MGFEIYGEKGKEYVANITCWYTLWSYVGKNCSDFLDVEDQEKGLWNDDHLITADKAVKIADRMDALVLIGEVQREHDEWIQGRSIKRGFLDARAMTDFAMFARESGGFRIG